MCFVYCVVSNYTIANLHGQVLSGHFSVPKMTEEMYCITLYSIKSKCDIVFGIVLQVKYPIVVYRISCCGLEGSNTFHIQLAQKARNRSDLISCFLKMPTVKQVFFQQQTHQKQIVDDSSKSHLTSNLWCYYIWLWLSYLDLWGRCLQAKLFREPGFLSLVGDLIELVKAIDG